MNQARLLKMKLTAHPMSRSSEQLLLPLIPSMLLFLFLSMQELHQDEYYGFYQ